jgi:glycosyltransferase involved in cell wall biosynthesis
MTLAEPIAESSSPVPPPAPDVAASPGPAAVVHQACTIVLPSSGAFDSRAWRIASSLAARGHTVTIVARSEPGLPSDETHPDAYRIIRVPVGAVDGLPAPIRTVVRLGRRGRASPVSTNATGGGDGRRLLARLRSGIGGIRRLAAIALTVRSQRIATLRVAPRADLVHAMAYMGIPVGLAIGRRDHAPVIYDARDIYVDARNIARLPSFARRLFAAVERRWARRASRVMTVNRPYAEVMAERFGVPLPAIVLNASYRQPMTTTTARPKPILHERLGLAPEIRLVLYHGGLSPDRGIEQLIDALPLLPADVHLVLLGYGTLETSLRAQAAEPPLTGRLHLLPAVPPAELLDWVASADVAAMPIQPTTLNHRLTTPNKLLEAMAVGVPVVASNLPGMAGIVEETGCGVLCDSTDPASIALAIRTLLDASPAEREARRERTLAAARGPYSWEAQLEILLAEYGRLTGRPW